MDHVFHGIRKIIAEFILFFRETIMEKLYAVHRYKVILNICHENTQIPALPY